MRAAGLAAGGAGSASLYYPTASTTQRSRRSTSINLELAEFGIQFTMQCGIHSGSAIAGIIGHKTFQYDLCGDAVNTAARMCSYSKPNHINISEATYNLLKNRFGAVPRGELSIKGKGKMNTYFLLNMPVEAQEVLQGIGAQKRIEKDVLSMVDRWGRQAKGKRMLSIKKAAEKEKPKSSADVLNPIQEKEPEDDPMAA